LIDCYDPDCDCQYTCADSTYPSCGGSCPYGEICRGYQYIWGNGCKCLGGSDGGSQSLCYETDSGDYPLVGGITYQSGSPQEDYCLKDGRTLVEYYCAGDYAVGRTYSCASVCTNCCCVSNTIGSYCGACPNYYN
jgi:hypothetical protein